MGNRVIGALVLFSLAWFLFAVWNVGGSCGVIKAYSKTKTTITINREGEVLPEYRPLNVIEYRISGTVVTRKVGNFLNKYEDCVVFDKANWECTYSDNSGTFGFKSGDAFSVPNTDKFPELSNRRVSHQISRFQFMLLQCRWDLISGPFQMIVCFARPFFT